MEDERGLYYLAQPGNPNVRVYTRMGENGAIEFRLWERSQPEVWEKHQWVPIDAIRAAAELYKRERRPDADPLKLYDEAIARSLLRAKK